MTAALAPGWLRIGLLADTHGWLDPALVEYFRGTALIVHAGDVGSPDVLGELERIAPLAAVRGNIDGGALADLPLTKVVEVGSWRIGVIHSAGSPSRPSSAARDLIRVSEPHVLVVGHSHLPVAGSVGVLVWINPGAAGREGFHQERTAGLLDIGPDGQLKHYRVALGPRWSQFRSDCPP